MERAVVGMLDAQTKRPMNAANKIESIVIYQQAWKMLKAH